MKPIIDITMDDATGVGPEIISKALSLKDDLTNTKDYGMMLIVSSLKVTHVTTHMSLREACNKIKKEAYIQGDKIDRESLKRNGDKNPRIAAAGLNPHCGEGGLFGKEEIEEIEPAVEIAKKEGINVIGQLPADTVFVRTKDGAYDAVVAMYHDQGHIPIKMLGLEWDEKRQE
mgnify:CR=1 FL=1